MQSLKKLPFPFFLSATLLMITLGAVWGTFFLWQLKATPQFTSLDLLAINAHGQAQIYGWVGLMIMGTFYRLLPSLPESQPVPENRQFLVLGLILLGVILNFWSTLSTSAFFYASLGNGCIVLAVLLFAFDIVHSLPRFKVSTHLFLYTTLFFLVLSSIYAFWHHGKTLVAPNEKSLFAQVATFQAPLRDLQIHGAALFAIFTLFLAIFTPPNRKKIWTIWSFLIVGVVGEVVVFLAYRLSQNHWVAALLSIAWLSLLVGSFLFFMQMKRWKDTSFTRKFFLTAFGWLLLSEVMLLFLPLYSYLAQTPFSHAYYGAIRHAVTVGFVSLSLFGIAARLFPGLSPSAFWTPFILLNMGCFARVSLQVLTDWYPVTFSLIGISGALEILAILFWGFEFLLKRVFFHNLLKEYTSH